MTTDYLQVAAAASSGTSMAPIVKVGAAGTDTNINLEVSAVGAGNIILSSSVDVQSNPMSTELTADSCGVTNYDLVYIDAGTNPISVRTPTSTTGYLGTTSHGFLGIATVSKASGTAVIATSGQYPCNFDAVLTSGAGDWVQASTTTAGACHDSGSPATSAPPSGAQVIGILLSNTAVPGTTRRYMVFIKPAF